MQGAKKRDIIETQSQKDSTEKKKMKSLNNKRYI